MVGITLTPEQIRSAPADVRRWLEQQLAISFGLQSPEPAAPAPRHEHLLALSEQDVAAMLPLIRRVFPAVNVFFELGRRGEAVSEDIEAFRLADIMRHARLDNMEQVQACLELVNDAAKYVRSDPDGRFCLVDPKGYCLVATATQQSIFRIWQKVIQATQETAPASLAETAPNGTEPQAFGLSAPIPATSMHMDESKPL